MMNNNFYNPGDLNDNGFKVAGNLESEKNSSFYNPGSLSDNGFKVADNLEQNNISVKDNNSTNEVEEYLKSVVTGKKTPPEFGHFPIAAGQKFVSFDELKAMVDRGDNIIKAEYFEQMEKILIEFETFELENNEVRHR